MAPYNGRTVIRCHRGNFVEIIRRRIIIDRGAPRKGDGIQTSQEPSLERRAGGRWRGAEVPPTPTADPAGPRAAMRFRNVGYTPPPLRVTGYLYAYPPGPSGDGWLDAARLCCHVPAVAALQPAWLQRPRVSRAPQCIPRHTQRCPRPVCRTGAGVGYMASEAGTHPAGS